MTLPAVIAPLVLVELVMSLAALALWSGVTYRYRAELRAAHRERQVGSLLVMVVIWGALFAFAFRAFVDIGVFSPELGYLEGVIVRGILAMVAIALIVGPKVPSQGPKA